MSAHTELYKIDHQSKLPLYDQIERNLRDLIINGMLEAGQAVPSEWELSTLYSVSRLTVRRAIDELVRQNWLVRRQGVGTFVVQPSLTKIGTNRLSFTEQMLAVGRKPDSRLVSVCVVPATAKIARLLGLREGEPLVEIVRVRLADNDPILLETSYLAQGRFPGLEQADWLANGSLYAHLRDDYNLLISDIDQTLKPLLLTESEARHLETQPGSPAILSEIVANSSLGEAVEYTWAIARGDKCEFYYHFRSGQES
jgi:GntR family transcriptional regulator